MLFLAKSLLCQVAGVVSKSLHCQVAGVVSGQLKVYFVRWRVLFLAS